jgi:hypothetical protein
VESFHQNFEEQTHDALPHLGWSGSSNQTPYTLPLSSISIFFSAISFIEYFLITLGNHRKEKDGYIG